MKNTCFTIGLVMYVLFEQTLAAADTPKADVHIVFAFDQSDSMFDDTDVPVHAELQSEALSTFFGSFQSTCVSVEVDFLPWGTTAEPPYRGILDSPLEAKAFWSDIAAATLAIHGTTNHRLAFMTAIELLSDPEVTNILVFTTDEASQRPDGYVLKQWTPPYVDVYAISLGNDSVYQYVEHEIVNNPSNHFHAETSDEFKRALDDVMQVVTNKFCLF